MTLRALARQLHRSHSPLVEYELGHRLAPFEVVTGYERVLGLAPKSLVSVLEQARKALESEGRPSGRSSDEAPDRQGPSRWRLLAGIGAAVLLLASALLVWSLRLDSGDPHTRWGAGGRADERFHCSGYVDVAVSNGGEVKMQTCIVVTVGAAGTDFQGLLAISNLGSTTASLEGTVATAMDGARGSSTNCGRVTIAPRSRRWCFTPLQHTSHGHPLASRASLKSTVDAASTESPSRMS